MSVSDPLIRDIKGCVLKLHTEYQNSGRIVDSNQNLLELSQILEDIFYRGFVPKQVASIFVKNCDVYTWMSGLSVSDFAYKSSIDLVDKSKRTSTTIGRFRLLVRCCLAKRCMHVPVEGLMRSNKSHMYYQGQSIMGDEILSAILLSVLLQCGRINFELDLDNASFLDMTWQLPDMVRLELVPCVSLGIGVSFSQNKAVIIDVHPNSVVSENGKVLEGDILDSLNGIHLDQSCKGRLNAIFKINKGRPVLLVVIKAFHAESNDIFPYIKTLLLHLQVDVDKLRNKYLEDVGVTVENGAENDGNDISETKFPESNISFPTRPGYEGTYLGSVEVGDVGNVKQIEKAIKCIMAANSKTIAVGSSDLICKNVNSAVVIEIGEMCIKVTDTETGDLMSKHSYMQISSCGSLPYSPSYVAYIAGPENCDKASDFTCHVFHIKDVEDACTVLQSIGQGFHRTHFAV